ncbi:MAG: thioredoxin domain-containing protein [Planctomycetes bacterium]|nr:thioredoxin domain-containing protein [Planctomycetota bacterium]
MDWLEWNDDAFALARERSAPVLLFLGASWCRFCKELDEFVLSDERVARVITQRFVPIRVDKDRRPDIDARYSKGGWPTLAYLDDQGELIASDAYLEVDELLPRLELIANYFAQSRGELKRRLSEADERPRAARARRGELDRELVDWVAKTVLETSDPVFGGWGREHKFPHFEAIDFALIRWSQTGDDAMRKLVLRTLRGMQQGEIHDKVEGGFYRYATQPDWSRPHYEKMLDSNAQRLFSYLEAYQAFGDASFKKTAEGILDWLVTTLLDRETGAFKGSQDANPGYAHLATRAARREFGAPACDPTIFANWNAITVSSLFKAALVLGQEEVDVLALHALDFVLEELYDERHGVYHYWDGTYHLPGMLADQAYTLRALVDAVQFTGENRYLEPARALASHAIETLSNHDEGGFWDLRHDPKAHGGLKRRTRSILENAVMAEALLRLGLVSHENDWAHKARETLESFAADYKRYGHMVAGYARAVDLFLHPPIHVIVVGPRAASETTALRRAALAPYVASRVVQVIDPAHDVALLERSGFTAGKGGARAYLRRGRESYAETSDPARLPALLARIERGS